MDDINFSPSPETAAIKSFLETITRRWAEIGADEWLSLHIRLLGNGKKVMPLNFRPDEDGITWAAATVADMNAKGRNAYVCPNPIRENVTGTPRDDDMAAAFHVWCDCDDEAATEALKAFDGPKYSHVALTGTIPHHRAHAYWELAEPMTDLAEWTGMQKRIAAKLGSDAVVCNPSRLMRIPGTITWPSEQKQKRGYVSEVTQMIDKGSNPVEWSSLDRAFTHATPQAPSKPLSVLAVHTNTSGDTSLEIALSALVAIPNNLDRSGWLKIASALKLTYGDQAKDAFLAWSATWTGGESDPAEDLRAWQTLKPDGSATMGSVIWMAQQAGWVGSGAAASDDIGAPLPAGVAVNAFRDQEPQPLVREIPPGAPYPVDNLGPLRAAVEAVQGMTQAPIAIPAQSALSVASLAVQGFADVETLGGNRPVSLNALTIAGSGERKSACDAPLLEGLREYEVSQAKIRRDEMDIYRNDAALWKGDRESILGDAKRSKGKGEKRIAARADLDALGPEPQAPPSADRTVTEPTFEGLTKLYEHGCPSLGIFSEEGAQFLGGHAMSRDHRTKTLGALNDLWQGNPIRRTRAGDGHETLFGRRLAIHLMVQPTVAYQFMANPLAADTGFLPRFLMCEPTSTIGSRMQANTRRDDAALASFASRLRDILEMPLPIDPDTGALEPRTLILDPDARKILIGFADAIEIQQAPGGDLAHVTGTASKAAEQACRISGVLTLWRDLQAEVVTVQDMADGITLAQFYLGEASRLASAATVSAEIDRAEKLRKWLLEVWQHPEVLVRDIVRRGPNPLRESPKARAALELLETHGWLVKLPPGTIVRDAARAESWRIVKGGGHVV